MTLNGVTINAQGASSAGVIIESGGTLIADDLTVINSSGYGVSSNGVITLNGTHITSANGHGVWFGVGSSGSVTGNAVIKTSGENNYGIFSSTDGAGASPLVNSGASVETEGKGAYGVISGNRPTARLQVNAATIVTHGDNADGARAASRVM